MLRDTSPTAIALNGQAADDKRVAVIYRCRLKPEQLAETDHPDIKFCDQCQQKVFKITDFDGFEKAVASKGCIWGPVNIRSPADKAKEMRFLGGPGLTDYFADSALTWDD
ncbi:hypothetical protein [Methylibium petroleiphilum]|uniref:Uncharacterized protein n=1 Tax=Methylibium petroleiphilum (strain ATCC BAA-1232 / LMG 22953 / PM1) TaxID=420662 RepID=A2SMH8_METPP|nr:hypothetical protein [Methylibium petroleiphilum]ABM96767.1 hypothetical protein Mpe_A3814 [Methylibium petroleiphilum PM1]